MDSQQHIDSLAYSQGKPEARAVIRHLAEDFQVEEIPALEPDGEGDHIWLVITKRHTNTDWVARILARHANVKLIDIGYAGIKDRHAVTTQSFTINISGKPEPDWSMLNSDTITIVKTTRHRKKLKRGQLKGNRFKLVLRQFKGDHKITEERLRYIAGHGVPNYFGKQRFGFNNLQHARALLVDKVPTRQRHKRSLYISAARSFLFNRVVCERVKQSLWNRYLPGDILITAKNEQLAISTATNHELNSYVESMQAHPTAPLWGRGLLQTTKETLEFEKRVLSNYSDWLTGLEHVGLQQQRRATRLNVEGLQWQWLNRSTLQLSFTLASGNYATSVLREIVDCS